MDQQELENKLEQVKDKLIDIEKKSDARIYLNCESENAHDICKYLFKDLKLRFVIVTGIDAEHCFEALYHFSNDETGTVVTVKAFIRDRENPAIESITPFVPAAEWIEREIHDVLGIYINNHPNLERLILADDWPEGVYPLRKETKE